MRGVLVLGNALAGLLILTAGGLAQTAPSSPPASPTHAGSAGVADTTIEGRIAEVFGGRFILETDRGRILVDPIGMGRALAAAPGDRVSATGISAEENTMLARRIVRPDGSILYEHTGPEAAGQPTAAPLPKVDWRTDIPAALAALELTPIGQPVRKKHHTEIMARMADGRTVFVSFDRLGRVRELEDAAHDKAAAIATRALTREDYDDIARRAGFQPFNGIETKRHHVELLTRNRTGELIELHIDRAGYIYKQVWLR